MTSVTRFVAAVLLAGTPQFSYAQGLSRESLAHAVQHASLQVQSAPNVRRSPSRAPALLPILIGAGIGGGLGIVVGHRTEAPVAIPMSMAAFGAMIGYMFSSAEHAPAGQPALNRG